MSAPIPTPTAPGTRPRVTVGVADPVRDAVVLAWARDEVAATGGRLTICRAGPPPTGWPTMDGLTLLDPGFARAVHDTRQRLGGERVDLWLEDGPPEAVLAAAAADADLVVLGPPTRHRSPAVHLAATAGQTVVIMRPGAGSRTAPFAGHVVAGVGSRADAPVVEFAVRYAAAHHLPVAAVHVSVDSVCDFWFDEDTLETHFRVEPPQLDLLASVVELVRARYPGVPVRLCALIGTPVDRLRAAGRGALLTVVGRRRRLIRSRSASLVRAAYGPLAVVPAGTGEE